MLQNAEILPRFTVSVGPMGDITAEAEAVFLFEILICKWVSSAFF